ncbi:MAG: lipase family protein [Fimbriimonadaceae bacterium]|nr:lipase family protein [Fimbriimonadaceae bacterium]
MKSAGLLGLAFLVMGCGGTAPFRPPLPGGDDNARGTLISYSLLRDYGEISMDTVLDDIEHQSGYDLSVTSDVSLYKVTYWTIDVNGQAVRATGAVAIPDTPTNPALVSYQHSTATLKTNVPSGNNDEAWAVLAVFAATGNYVVSMPDYLGLGDSAGMHPYLHAASEASASLDMIRASRTLCGKLNVGLSDKLFLHGYSQGGHATMALAREIETMNSNEFKMTAVAPGAGPYDLTGVELPFALNQPGPDTNTFLAYIVLAYRNIYGIMSDLSLVFQSPWDVNAPPLFDGSKDISTIAGDLPTSPSQLFTTGFIHDLTSNIGVPFKDKLQQNDVWQWVPKTTMKLFHAKSDNIVSFQNSQEAYNYMHANGAPVTLVDLGDNIDHLGGFYYAIPAARLWFDTLN